MWRDFARRRQTQLGQWFPSTNHSRDKWDTAEAMHLQAVDSWTWNVELVQWQQQLGSQTYKQLITLNNGSD